MLGTAAYDEGCAQLFCESGLMASLIELLRAHQEDDEIVLQILFVFQAALCHNRAADYIINQTGKTHVTPSIGCCMYFCL